MRNTSEHKCRFCGGLFNLFCFMVSFRNLRLHDCMKNGATGNHYTASKMLEKLLKPGSVSLLASSFALFRIWEVIQDSEPRPRPGTPQVTPGAFELPRRSP